MFMGLQRKAISWVRPPLLPAHTKGGRIFLYSLQLCIFRLKMLTVKLIFCFTVGIKRTKYASMIYS